MKKLLLATLIVLLVLTAGTAAVFWVPDGDRDELIEKYSNHNSRFLELPDGTRIHFRDEGLRDGPPLVLVHGNNTSLHDWEHLVTELSGEFRLISLDLPGHGLTGPSGTQDYSAQGLMQSINDVLDHLKIGNAVLVGNSMGGWVSWRYAIAFPDRIDGLVLISSSGAVIDEEAELYQAGKLLDSKIGKLLAPIIAPRSVVRKSLTHARWDDSQVTEELVERYRDLALFPGNRTAMVQRRTVDREVEYWSRIGEIDVPVLILWGEHDEIKPLSNAYEFRAELSNSQLIVYSDAAHAAMEERPAQVAQDIRRWYNENLEVKTSEESVSN